MRRAALALSAGGVLALAGAMLGLRVFLVPQPEIVPTRPPEQAPRPRSSGVDMAKQARVRPVAPQVVAPPRIAPDELQRVEPREPLSRFAQPLPQRPKNRGRIYRPLVAAAGLVAGSGLTVTIAGLEVTPADETCVDAEGRSWPCGVRARSAFRAFVRGRALACDLPDELDKRDHTVACTLGRQDVGAWLVSQGWARALPGGPYAEAGEAARAAGKGIFGLAPIVEPLPAPASAGDGGAAPPDVLSLPLE